MSKPKLYNLWKCPYGQRAWISLLHREVDFEYIEHDPYDKSPEWLAINPRGLVPAIVTGDEVVYESQICIEYVDEKWPGKGKPLLPKDPFLRAKSKIWCDHIGKKIATPFWRFMMTHGEDNVQPKQELLDGVAELCKEMDPSGPFFLGQEFSIVDVMFAPFAYRFGNIARHYRGFEIPAELQRYHKWWNAVKEVPSVKKTFELQNDEKLINDSKRFAEKINPADVKSESLKAALAGKAT